MYNYLEQDFGPMIFQCVRSDRQNVILKWFLHTFLFSSTWEKSSSMSIKYLSCREQHRKWHQFINHAWLVRGVCIFKRAGLTCLDLILLISPPFWLSSDVFSLLSSSSLNTHKDGQTLHHYHHCTDWRERDLSPLFLCQDEFGEIGM